MKKLLAVGVIVLFLGVSVIPSTGTTDVKQITVPTAKGNTLYVGGNGTGNYSKIQDAINDSSDGDTVFVFNGIYYEKVNVNKSISLIGEDKNNTVIDGNGFGVVVRISANQVNIKYFTIINGSVGIYQRDKNNSVIEENIIRYCFNYGIEFVSCGENEVIKNTVQCDTGIYLGGAHKSVMYANVVSNGKCGIYICESSQNYIVNNVIDWTEPLLVHK